MTLVTNEFDVSFASTNDYYYFLDKTKCQYPECSDFTKHMKDTDM